MELTKHKTQKKSFSFETTKHETLKELIVLHFLHYIRCIASYRNLNTIYFVLEMLPTLQNSESLDCLMWDGFGQWNNQLDWTPLLSSMFLRNFWFYFL